MLRPRSGSSNGCDRSGSECHIAGDMSVANFLLLYSFKHYINLLVNIMIGLYKIKYTMI